MGLTGLTYPFNTITSKTGNGADAGQLTNAYTAGKPTAVNGVGDCKARCKATIAGGGAGTIYFRVMDYTDASNPVPLQSENQSTGVRTVEHTLLATGTFDLEFDLGGTVSVIAIESKSDVAPAAGDAASVDLWGSEKF